MDQRGHTGISKIICVGWKLQFSGVGATVAIASKNWKVEDFTQLKYMSNPNRVDTCLAIQDYFCKVSLLNQSLKCSF